MRKMFLRAGAVFLLVLASCSSDDNSEVNNANISDIVNAAQNGTWKITSFIENNTNNETNHFTGYIFTFGPDNVLTAVKGGLTQTGSWSVTDSDNSDDDSSGSDIDFNINFASPDDFTDLNDDWDITEVSANEIKLIDISGGNGGTDTLIFQKN